MDDIEAEAAQPIVADSENYRGDTVRSPAANTRSPLMPDIRLAGTGNAGVMIIHSFAISSKAGVSGAGDLS